MPKRLFGTNHWATNYVISLCEFNTNPWHVDKRNCSLVAWSRKQPLLLWCNRFPSSMGANLPHTAPAWKREVQGTFTTNVPDTA